MKKVSVKKLIQKCHDASPLLAMLDPFLKNEILIEMGQALKTNQEAILRENKKDLKEAESKKLSAAMQDRLMLNEERIEEMAKALHDVAGLQDPVGRVTDHWVRPNGLKVTRVSIPLGVIAVVYESRPNVTVDAACLCFKSGNAVVLRGGSEACHSNAVLVKILQHVLKQRRLPKELITFVPTPNRKVLQEMLGLSGLIDVVIPRGGEGLMKFMEAHSKVPIIKHDKGVCNLFVDESCDLDMALAIVDNAKTQRPGVCNALENLFVHEKQAPHFLPRLEAALRQKGVELRGDPASQKFLPGIKKATEKDFFTEYLDLVLSIRIVKGLDEAIFLIRKYGSLHTETIVTQNEENAKKFVRSLDSSCVLVNASTRFNDGGQLGLGAEIGISTTKLHAFGPMGLKELTTTKFVVWGEGQVRE